jgi:NADH-quinone oxidoreductase subunit C
MVPVYKSRGWFERECWDLYGIYFSNNPDLRRILTDYGFRGFPLRKDFPLSGFIQSRYDHDIKKVRQEPTTFQFGQTYRYFDFKSPWENKLH